MIPKEIKYKLHYGKVRGDVYRRLFVNRLLDDSH